MMRWLTSACLAAVVFAESSARADLIVTIGSTTLEQGGTGFVDVFVRSTDGSDLLGGFGVEFAITNLSGSSSLWFSVSQNDAYLSDPNYIFVGDSSALSFPPVGVGQETAYIGGDATESLVDIQVPTSDRLLARLDLTTLTSAPSAIGDQFTISLVNSLNTFFFNSGDELPFPTTTPGTVTIAAAGVPEPSSLILAASALGAAGFLRRRRARQR